MKIFLALALLVGAVTAIPQGMITPAMRTMMQDMLKNMLRNMNIKPARPPPLVIPNNIMGRSPPANFAPPQNAFQNPMMGPHSPPHSPGAPNTGGGGMLSMPPGAPGFGGPGGYYRKEFCPPNVDPTTLGDACKDQILIEALYFPNGKPRYDWIGYPLPRWENSVPDAVKDRAQRVLYYKIGNRAPTPKEARILALLGDPPNHMRHLVGRVG